MNYITACPICVKQKCEPIEALIYEREGVGSCPTHGEMTAEEIEQINSGLVSPDKKFQKGHPELTPSALALHN